MTQREKDWIFVSDAHFTGREPGEMEFFLRFLDSETEKMGHLVILGDLFEFLFGFRTPSSEKVLPWEERTFAFPDFLPVFRRLSELSRRGIRIEYFEGNHDFFLSSFFRDQLDTDVEVHPDEYEERLGEKRAYIAHGDLSNPREWRYRTYRRIIKNGWTYTLMQLMGSTLIRQIAHKLGRMSYQKFHEGLRTPSPSFRAFAHQRFLEGFDIVILAHSHVPEEVEAWVDRRRCLYFNVGDWMIHRSFLRFSPPEHFELSQYKEKGWDKPAPPCRGEGQAGTRSPILGASRDGA